MKHWLFCILIFCSVLTGCRDEQKVQEAQKKLHQEILDRFDASLVLVEKHAQIALKQFLETYNHQKTCKDDGPEEKSSFYIPRSAHKGKELDCFRAASQRLDGLFDKFNHDVNFISWQYLYDGDSKTLRLFPETATKSLFGEDLTFDKFSFYLDAIGSSPQPTWGKVLRDDINGTGPIYIHSIAFVLAGHIKPTVISFDARPKTILQDEDENVLKFAAQNDLKHVFIVFYHAVEDKRIIAHEFSTDPQKWISLRPNKGQILNLTGQELETLNKFVAVAQLKPDIQSTHIEISDSKYLCTFTHSKLVRLMSLLCVAVGQV